MLRLLALGLVAYSALSVGASPAPTASPWTPTWTSHTWNEYLDAEGIFPAHLDSLPITKPASGLATGAEYESLQGHLQQLLGQPGVLSHIYANYLTRFNKTGDSHRAQTFKAALLDIARHNAATAQGKMSWTKGVNSFSDMTFEEFKGRFIGSMEESRLPISNGTAMKSAPFLKAASTVDWRNTGCVTGVKQQSPCNDCFMFAALAVAETAYCQRNGGLVDFSVQHVLDCCPHQTCWENYPYGCANPGFTHGALRFAQGGLIRESDYPYEGKDGQCRANGKRLFYAVFSFNNYWQGGVPNEQLLGEHVARNPVSVAIDPSSGFQGYKRGLYDRDIFTGDCNNEQTGHAVTAVGYGPDYWIIKNSWGPGWGMGGYIYLKRGQNKCGVGRQFEFLTS